jgi:N-acyl-D-aspartate/D-glutamate deacylase
LDLDLVIRHGLVVDGSGHPGRRADVAVVGDRIVAVGEVDGRGREEVDADGLVVAPGFVDGHTHMDAQVFWDDLGTSSCWHGVTTVVMGNCGFTLAPSHADARGMVLRNLERAEDIPAAALEQGVPWSWSTYAEYLDAVDGLPKGINYAGAVGHSALRTWAMGERAFSEPAGDDDLRLMRDELRDGLRAGAVGFSTSRSHTHETADNRPVASRLARWDEVRALVDVLAGEQRGVFEISHEEAAYGDADGRTDYWGRLQDLALSTQVPITFSVYAIPIGLHAVPIIADTAARGGTMYGLTHCRGIITLQSFETRLAFDALPEWRSVRDRPLAEQQRLLRDPEVRARLVDAAHHGTYARAVGPEAGTPDFDAMYVMESPYLPNPSIADVARRRGVDPVEAMIDVALERDFEVFFTRPITPQPDDELLALMRSPNTAMTFSDAGAHVSQTVNASLQTHMLAYWVRERQALSLEEAVSMMTRRSANVWRLTDRGALAPGFAADITIFDAGTVAPRMPRVVADLPGGGVRIEQHADGYAATIVNGRVFTRDGKPTETRSGRLLRAGRMVVPTPVAVASAE